MKRLFPALCALLFVGGILACLGAFSPADGHAVRSGGSNPPRFSGYSFIPITLAADSADTTRREIATTPSTRSDFAHDSLSKPIRILTKNGDTTGKYVPREMIMRVLDGYTYTGRDSVFEFVDTLCIKWFIRLPATKEGHVRVYAIDTCETECRPQIGDEDNVFKDACDSIKIRGKESWVHVFYAPEDDAGPYAIGKTLKVSVDTVWIPFHFQIYKPQDNTGTSFSPKDSTNNWFVPSAQPFGIASAYPVGSVMRVKKVAWNSMRTGATLYGGVITMSDVPLVGDKGIVLRWITNPASRSSDTDPTTLSIYTSNSSDGAGPHFTAGATVWGRNVVLDDQGAHTSGGAKGQSILVQVTVWAYFVSFQ